MNSRGPRTESWGTPQDSCEGVNCIPLKITAWVLLVRYELNQLRATSLTAKRWCSTSRSMEWSTQSNAALRSSKTSATTCPLSTDQMMSFTTLTTAVSVLWLRRYADCLLANRLLRSTCSENRTATTLSSSFQVWNKAKVRYRPVRVCVIGIQGWLLEPRKYNDLLVHVRKLSRL